MNVLNKLRAWLEEGIEDGNRSLSRKPSKWEAVYRKACISCLRLVIEKLGELEAEEASAFPVAELESMALRWKLSPYAHTSVCGMELENFLAKQKLQEARAAAEDERASSLIVTL